MLGGSFASCAVDTTSLQYRTEEAIRVWLNTAGSDYRKIEAAASCIAVLTENNFPPELSEDAALVFSVLQYSGRYHLLPRQIKREWFPALLHMYRLVMIALGAGTVVRLSIQRREIDRSEAAMRIEEACRENISSAEIEKKFFRSRNPVKGSRRKPTSNHIGAFHGDINGTDDQC